MEAGCFERDANGTEIVNLTKSLHDNNYVLEAHKVINAVVCTAAIFLNGLLGVIILKSNAEMFRMRPILWFGLIVDMLSSILNLIASPIANWSHNRWIAINNSPIQITNAFANSVLMSLVATLTLASWTAIPFQFAYRYFLVKDGNRPRGIKLFVFASLLLFFVLVALAGTLHLYTDTDDHRFLREAMNILDHAGYSVKPYNVHGATVYDERMKTWNSYVMFNTLTGYAVVILCSVKIRKFIQKAAMSNKTKRLNADMDKVLLSLALVPIATTIAPSFFGMFALSKCELSLITSFLVSLNFAVSPMLNPCLVIYFVQPYKRTMARWLHMEHLLSNQFTTSVQSISNHKPGTQPAHMSKTISTNEASTNHV